LLHLAIAEADLGRLNDVCRTFDDDKAAMEAAKERMYEAEVNRVAGEIALKSPEHGAAKAEAYFERRAPSRANNMPNPGNSAPL
jgi:hypothetical protein